MGRVMSRGSQDRHPEKPWVDEPPEIILAKRQARRLASRVAKPAYVNTDACCRGKQAGLASESALFGRRMERVFCSDGTLAEYLALLMAILDADSRLPGKLIFRVDSAAVLETVRHSDTHLDEARRQIDDLLSRHQNWSAVLVARQSNRQARSLASRSLRDDI